MYFDIDTILSQFERLFQMLEFKQAYKGHWIEIIVDTARIHTTKMYSLQDFRKGIGAQCPTEKIQYVDENGVRQVIDCYFKQGPHKGKSKGLVEICKDLGVKLSDKVKLPEIYEKLAKYRAFQKVSQVILYSETHSVLYSLLYFIGSKIRDVGEQIQYQDYILS